MDKIHLNDLAFFGYHGALPEENVLGQTYRISLALELDLSKAGQLDDLTETIDYREAIRIVKETITGPPQRLIETLAEQIARRLLETFPSLQAANILLKKPNPPVGVELAEVAVEIRRERRK